MKRLNNKALLLSFFIFLFNVFNGGCSSPALLNSPDSLQLTTQKASLTIRAKVLTSDSLYIPPVHKTTQLRKLQEHYLLVDEFSCDPGYRFESSAQALFELLYPVKKIHYKASTGNIYLFKANIAGKEMFVILYNRNKSLLRFVYPVPQELFKIFADSLELSDLPSGENTFTLKEASLRSFSHFDARLMITRPFVRRVMGGKSARQ